MLNIQEQQYFDNIVKTVTQNFNIKIPIISMDHTTLKGKYKEACGIAWSYDKNTIYKITIDEVFIKACYNQYLWENHKGGFPKAYPEELEEVICHEIAHMTHWRHGKKHRELTQRLINSLT